MYYEAPKVPRRVIVDGYSPLYCRKLLDEGIKRYGSLRQVASAIGISTSVIYRWYHNEQRMGKVWVENLERLLLQ